MNLLRKNQSPERGDGIPSADRAAMDKEQDRALRREKAANRSAVMARTREARKAAGAMKAPEPRWAIYCAVALLALAAYSFFSPDISAQDKTVKHKTVLVDVPVSHPGVAIVVAVLVLGTLVTLYWRRRIVTVVAFMITAAIGVDIPLPKNAQDVKWLAFLIPAGFALWVWGFRMRKDQSDWLAANGATRTTTTTARTTSGRASTGASAAKGQRAASSAKRGKSPKQEPAVGLNGRALPASTGRYTRPQAKGRQVAQRRP